MALYIGNMKVAGGGGGGGGEVPPDSYKTYDDTVSSLSSDGYATQAWVEEQKSGHVPPSDSYKIYDTAMTEFDFGNGDISSFNWEGVLAHQTLVNAGLKSAINRWTKMPYAVRLGDKITGITDDFVFCYCKNLVNITMPDSVISVGDYAFGYCYGLRDVAVGNGVTSIGVEAFSGCRSLTSVTIPDSVTSIGEGAFSGCGDSIEITVKGKTQAEAQSLLASASLPPGHQIKIWKSQDFCYGPYTVRELIVSADANEPTAVGPLTCVIPRDGWYAFECELTSGVTGPLDMKISKVIDLSSDEFDLARVPSCNAIKATQPLCLQAGLKVGLRGYTSENAQACKKYIYALKN